MTQKRPPRTTKHRYHHGDLRAALIASSLELIQQQGVRALTLREIGKRVGVSRMAAYRHFADKEDLLHAISEAGFAQFADALETARDSAPASFAARMDRMAVAYLRFAFEHPAHYEVMFSSAMKPEDNEAEPGEQAARAFAVLEKTIQEAQLSGEIRREDSATLARIVWALVHGISMLRLEADTSDQGAGTKLALFASEVIRTGLELRPRPVYTPGLTA